MYDHFLLSRVLLRFERSESDLLRDLSAVAVTPDGSLWTGSDELLTVERLSPVEPYIFSNHEAFFLGDFVPLFDHEEEIDIEGMDYSQQYLWVTGSHSTKRKKPKEKKPEKDFERLQTIKTELNRNLLLRIPLHEGKLFKSYADPEHPDQQLQAGTLQTTETSNILIEQLQTDPHLAPFLQIPLPSKDNGIDIEGLAVSQNRVFLGLRGPVLRGWAIIIEFEVEETPPGGFTLREIGDDPRFYRKHFVYLNGLGIRELCFKGEHLIILAGPTMALEGVMQVFRLNDLLEPQKPGIYGEDSDNLELLFTLPFTIGSDHAEGMALFPCLGQSEALLVVYDSPDPARRPAPNEIFADVFKLP